MTNTRTQKNSGSTARRPSRMRGQDWPWPIIRAELELQGFRLADLSRECGMSRTYFQKVSVIPIPKAQAVIARKLGLAATTIWPTRYRRDGRPISRILWLQLNQPSTGRRRRLADSSPVPSPEHAA